MKPEPAPTPAAPLVGFEEAFQRETRELLGYRFRLSFSIGIVLYLAFSGLDWFFARETWGTFLVMRVAVAAIAGTAIGVSRTKWGDQNVLPISFMTLSVASLVLSAMTAMLDGFSSHYFYGNMLVLFLVGLFMPWKPGVTLTFCSLVTCGYLVVNLWAHSLGLEVVQPFFFLLGTCALTFLGSTAIERSRRAELRQRMELEVATEQLKELDATKTRFFANVSHELRTPLMLILGPLEQMLAGRVERDPRPLLESMDLASRRLLKQINTILDFAKLEAGGQELSLQTGNVGEVLHNLVRAAEPHADIHAMRLESKGLDEVPNSIFDSEKVETIASNLLGNALKFTGDGGRVTLRAGVDGQRLWFEVEDTGIGIPQGQIARVFERFHQVAGTRSGKVQGTGLGLSLAREFALLHGGDITVRSTVNVGTTFRVELPLEPMTGNDGTQTDEPISPAAAARLAALRSPGEEAGAERTAATGRVSQTELERNKGKTAFADLEGPRLSGLDDEQLLTRAGADAPLILVVEDNDDMRALISGTLANRYRVATACDGEQGIAQAERYRPDLIVSDVMMPKLDGMGMLARLRERSQFKKTPIILVTARTGTESVVHGLSMGATDYVTKPFQFTELEARIDAQLKMVQTLRALDERETRLAAVGQQAAQIAHDLRSPLTAVMLRTESLRHTLLDLNGGEASSQEQVQAQVEVEDDDLVAIRNSVNRASGMVSELVEFLKGGQVPLERSNCELGEFLHKVGDDLAGTLRESELELVLQVEPPDLCVSMDRERMTRVVENLLHNAHEAMRWGREPKGSRIWLQAFTQDNHIILRVADNGPGILPQIRERLFQAFETAGKTKGTGLGLAISRNIVHAHGGTLEVENAPPEGGAAFRITLDRDQSFWEGLLGETG
jgi:signal transduction histidine kinase